MVVSSRLCLGAISTVSQGSGIKQRQWGQGQGQGSFLGLWAILARPNRALLGPQCASDGGTRRWRTPHTHRSMGGTLMDIRHTRGLFARPPPTGLVHTLGALNPRGQCIGARTVRCAHAVCTLCEK